MKKIITKKYIGWGKLSKKFLTKKYYTDQKTKIKKSILDLLEETSKNFMQIINDDEYNFQKMISEYNNLETNKKINYKLVENLVTSPSTKRGIYQALKLVKEITDYIGYDPEYIVIEMPRGNETKQRKIDKKKYLTKLYEVSKNNIENYKKLSNELKSYEKIETQKIFLYFIQEGKSLYSGKPLNINDLSSYEIDHIIPKTLIKDDSIDNKALVLREENQAKGANYTIPKKYIDLNKKWWEHLKKIKLISAKKFYNLTRKEYKQEDIDGFINRQLVETRQITKHVANILDNIYKTTKIIYLNADLPHNYREKFELYKFRIINNYHHAHDAYLAAVLGEYKEKYLKRDLNYELIKEFNSKLLENKDYKNLKYGYVINSLDSNLNKIINKITQMEFKGETGKIIFNAEEFNKRIFNNLYRNDILISRKTEIRNGKFYKETIWAHNDIKIKSAIPRKGNLNPKLYGFYSELKPSYLSLVKYKDKNYLIGIPIMCSNKNKKIEYITNYLKCNTEDLEILINRIPFYTMIEYKNQKVYLTGSGELMNAYELKIPKEKMIKWKYTLNLILNNKKIPQINQEPLLTENEISNQTNEIIEYLLSLEEQVPLYKKSIQKIKCININDLDIENRKKLIIELFKMLSSSKLNADLKFIGGTSREGRLTFSNIEHACIINKSISGLKELKNEF